MTNAAAFLGAWLVSEYVFDRGHLAGVIRQRRELRRRADGAIEVLQRCEPDAGLAGHPMQAFRGEWVFVLRPDGRTRRYLGPDVLGEGLTWGDGALTGRGVWPRFGYSFTSFSVMAVADRQITGGSFFAGGDRIANVIGLAVPETPGARYPDFEGPAWPSAVSNRWRGSRRTLAGDGALVGEAEVERIYADEAGYHEPGFSLALRPEGERLFASGALTGIGTRAGWMLELAGVDASGAAMDILDVVDPAGGYLISLRRRMRGHAVEQVEVVRLQPHA